MAASFPGQHRHLPYSEGSLEVKTDTSTSSFPSITTSSNSSIKLSNTDSTVHNQLKAASKSSALKIESK